MKEFHTFEELPYRYKLQNLCNMKKEAAYLYLTGKGIPVILDNYKLVAPENWEITNEEEYITNFLCTPYTRYNDKKFIANVLA